MHGHLVHQHIANEIKAKAMGGVEPIKRPEYDRRSVGVAAFIAALAITAGSIGSLESHEDAPSPERTNPALGVEIAQTRVIEG